MLRTVVWAGGWVVLAGCAGRGGDPFAAIDARLAAREWPGKSDAGGSLTPDGSGVVEAPGGLSGFRTVEAKGYGPRDEDGGDSFCLTSHPTLALAPEVQDSAGDETATATVAERSSRRRTPLPGFWDTVKRDLESMPADLWDDTKAVYGSAPNLVILGLTYGGMLAVQETGPDDTIEHGYRHHTTFDKGARDAFGAVGNPATHFALAGAWYLLGQQTQNDKTYNVGRTLFSALIINGLSTLAGQAATWDRAPNGEWGTFPSGHVSSTFTFASVMHDAYGPFVGVPLYGLGVLVAFERLEDDEHYFSDVLMGGVMGLVIGHTVAGEHEFKLFGGEVLPYADPYMGSSGVAWVKHFK